MIKLLFFMSPVDFGRKLVLTLFFFAGLASTSGIFGLPVSEKATSLPLIGIRINGGARYTNNRSIEVEIKSMKTDKGLLESMKVGFDPTLASVPWQTYSEDIFRLQLEGGEGEKVIYAQLKDKAGNISLIESYQIYYDVTPPEAGEIAINQGEKYMNDKLGRVLLSLNATDVHEIMVSNTAQFQNGKWEPYKESVRWIIDLGSGDGIKNVYVKFRDQAGNESTVSTASIILDTTPPVDGTITINNNEKYTRSTALKVLVQSKDATKVRLVSREVGKNYDFSPENNGRLEIIWEVDSSQGMKNLKAYFMDEAKNATKIPAEANILLKTIPPKRPLINIDQGKKTTNHAQGIVMLRFASSDPPQGLRMLVSNKPNLESATESPFTAAINSWKLDAESDGIKTVYARLIDEAGNISETGNAEIILDRTPPTVTSFSVNNNSAFCIGLSVPLTSEVIDAHEAQFSNMPFTARNVAWEKYSPIRTEWMILPGDGEKAIYARFRDIAGNISEPVVTKVTLDMTPPKGQLIINGGKKVTNEANGLVKIQLIYDTDVVGMQLINEADFTTTEVVPATKTLESYALDAKEDGLKTIYARVQDKAGNFSKVFTAGIVLDRVPPANCELIVNNNDAFITNPSKKVAISLRGEGASHCMVSNKEDFDGAVWLPFKTVIPWTLEGPEGTHYVHVKFRDEAGNESSVITRMVKSDFSPPKIVLFEINGGDEFVSDPQGMVSLTFTVEDAVAMAISNTSIKDTSQLKTLWEPYQTKKSWKLEGEDGLKMVYGRFRDEAGNITIEYYDKIILDKIPPTDIKISINGGAPWFTDKSGKAAISLVANGASEVMLANSSDFSKSVWEPMVEYRKDWTLNTTRETAEIHVKFKDKAGNISQSVSAAIKVDLEAPKNPGVVIDNNAKYVTSKEKKITLALSASGATGMRISQHENFRDARWEPFLTSRELVLNEADGEKTFYVQFVDDAGNMSDIASSKIILDTTPPLIKSFTINGGEEWTNDTNKKVKLSVEAEGATEIMISDNPTFTSGNWLPFSATISDHILPGEDGEKIIFIQLRDEIGNLSRPASAKINLKRSF